MEHKAGFVNIIGSPNMGKSTLMNAWMGEKFAITTHKAQTTRHRILGFLNDDHYQIVFSDTPGILEPAYKLQEKMLSEINSALQDADVLIWVTDIHEKRIRNEDILAKVSKMNIPVLVLVNKIDEGDQKGMEAAMERWKEWLPNGKVIPISALHGFHVKEVLTLLIDTLPVSPPYYDKEDMSDRPMRFFVSEAIREKIFLYTDQEIPYASEVVVEAYKNEEDIVRIRAEIIVERETQKVIVIGKEGSLIKKIGQTARKDLEKFIGKKIFLDLHVRVDKDWRNKDQKLKKYGYK